MPKVTVTDTKGLVQEAGSGVTFESDLVIKSDGIEVARAVAAASLPAAAGTSTAVSSASVGLAYRRRVIKVDSGHANNVYDLAASDSGSIIVIEPSLPLKINLPLAGTNDVGMYFTFIFLTKESNAVKIATKGTDNNDTFYLMSVEEESSAADIVLVDVTGGKDVLTITNAGKATKIEVVCVQGGAAEIWSAHALCSDSVAPALGTT
jgi:hypothetical protein